MNRKKQNRGIETRAKILDVTKKLLSDHDFYSVTLDQISHESEVAKSSLLWHFESKELLLSEAACVLFAELEEAIILVKDDEHTIEQRLEAFIENLADYFEKNPEPKGVLLSLIFNSKIPDTVRERIDTYWKHHLEALVHFFSYPDKPFSMDAANTILDLIHGSYVHWYLHKDSESFKEKLSHSFKYMSFS